MSAKQEAISRLYAMRRSFLSKSQDNYSLVLAQREWAPFVQKRMATEKQLDFMMALYLRLRGMNIIFPYLIETYSDAIVNGEFDKVSKTIEEFKGMIQEVESGRYN